MGKVIAGLTLAGEVAIMATVVYASTFGYAGTRRQVMAHANIHPIGTPADMAEPVASRAPYEGEA